MVGHHPRSTANMHMVTQQISVYLAVDITVVDSCFEKDLGGREANFD